VYPVLFRLGPFTVYSFGAMVALGFLAAYALTNRYLKQHGDDGNLTSSMFLAALIGGIGGARLYYALEHIDELLRDPIYMLISSGGLTYYGGLIGGAVAVALVIAWSRARFAVCADGAAPGVLAGYILGRIGCQLSGDGDYGLPSSVPWAMAYPRGTVPTLERVHPTPIYDVLLCLPILLLLLHLRRRPHRGGDIFGLFLGASAAERFVVEFWRHNPVVGAGLTAAQWWSLAMIALACVLPRIFRAIDARRALDSTRSA
jgi:phosphatidylglycerol:prolipoprotein diacylglycerol transferase